MQKLNNKNPGKSLCKVRVCRKHLENKKYHGDPGPGTEKEEETGSLGLHQVPTLGERCSDFQQGGGVHDLIDGSHLAAMEREHMQG